MERQVFALVARVATSAGVPKRAPLVRGRPERPVRGGGNSCSTEVTFNGLVQLMRRSRLSREGGQARAAEPAAAQGRVLAAAASTARMLCGAGHGVVVLLTVVGEAMSVLSCIWPGRKNTVTGPASSRI